MNPSLLGQSFHSILFQSPDLAAGLDNLQQPDYFVDLNLDQILDSMSLGRGQYNLSPYFFATLHTVDAVCYRQEILKDMEAPAVLDAFRAFGQEMRRMREKLAKMQKLHYKEEKQRWFLDAAWLYHDAVCALTEALSRLDISSLGLRAFREYLGAYTQSNDFLALGADTQAVNTAIEGVEYSVRIHGGRVTVRKYCGESDFSEEIVEVFSRFKQGAVQSYLVKLDESTDMNQVEARIMALVAKLFPDVFALLNQYVNRHQHYLDCVIGIFDREVQLYLAYLEHIQPLKAAGLPFCYPDVRPGPGDIEVKEAYDLAPAQKLATDKTHVVCNDFFLMHPERILVVTGPNQGGKTTFARMFGQLHHLAGLGLPVPTRSACLALPDRLFTHFEREEDIETLHGKLEDELVRIHDILDKATSESILIMNESFSSTALQDAEFLGTEVIRRIIEVGSLAVCVTFVDELTRLGPSIVSMASMVVPDNPAERTYKIERKAADGLAYAWAIAQKYGLTYDCLVERVAS